MKFDVSKSIMIDAPLSDVRAMVEDFTHWNSWSPWTVAEPECKVTIVGTAKRSGHVMNWDGEIIGSGQNRLIEWSEHRLDYALEFFKPWKSKADVSFFFEEKFGQTKVTWEMHSHLPIFMFFMVGTMRNMIGMDYDRGLNMLKEVTEKGIVNCQTVNKGSVAYKGFSYIGIKRRLPFAEMPAAMSADMRRLVDEIVIKGGKSAQHWVSIYPQFDMKKMECTYIAAVSDEELADFELGDDYVRGHIADSQALEITHKGAYDFIGNAWSMGMMFMRAKKLKRTGAPFEQYWNSPLEVTPEELMTSVYFPHR